MRRLLVGTIAVLSAVASTPLGALAASSPPPTPSPAATPTSRGRGIAVSVPSDAISLSAGQTGRTTIRVVDPTVSPVVVTVRGEGLDLGDDGKVTFSGKPDPVWAKQADFPPGELMVPAMGYIDVPITIRMPLVISPDLYYLGFVVRPVAASSGVTVINQIGGFVTVDVPGPRVRVLTAELEVDGFNFGPFHLSSVLIGDKVNGHVRVHNVGGASSQFYGENDVTTWLGAEPTQQRFVKSLLPAGRSRSVVVSGLPGGLIDVVTLTDTITYTDKTATSTKDILATKRVLVISPWVLLIIFVIIVGLLIWRIRARLRRRARDRLTRKAGHARLTEATDALDEPPPPRFRAPRGAAKPPPKRPSDTKPIARRPTDADIEAALGRLRPPDPPE